jgi:TRAP-type C4-dicarboxylate transport system permease small subunit
MPRLNVVQIVIGVMMVFLVAMVFAQVVLRYLTY